MNDIVTSDPKERRAAPPVVATGYAHIGADRTDCPTQRLTDAVADDAVRLVTVTGTAGVGKSHLVRQWVRQAHTSESLTVTVLDCTKYATVDEALATLSDATAHHASTERRDARSSVVILDDADRFATGLVTLVDELTSTRARITIVLTSRTSLDLHQEHLIRVAPLELCSMNTVSGSGAADVSPAVEFLIDGIVAKGESAATADSTLPLLDEIARHSEGNPLALLLAASSICTIGAAATLSKLRRGDELPPRRSTNVPDRHSCMSRALEWSNLHLSHDEDTLLTRLSITALPFDLSTATTVGGFDDSRTTELLDHLVHSSLVDCTSGWPYNPRYTVPRSVRLHHRAKLQADAEHLRSIRIRYYTCVARSVIDGDSSMTDLRERRFVDAQLNDYFEAVDHFHGCGDYTSAISILVAMEKLWTRTDRLEIANTQLIRSLMALDDQPSTAHTYSRGCEHSAKWALLIGNTVAAEYLSREALSVAADHRTDHCRSIAEALLGEALRRNGDQAGAREFLTSSLARSENQQTELHSLVGILCELVGVDVDDKRAGRTLHSALDRVQRFGDPRMRSYGLRTLTEEYLDRRNYALAQRSSLELLAVQLHSPSTADVLRGFETLRDALASTGPINAGSSRRIDQIVYMLEESGPIEWLVGATTTLGFTWGRDSVVTLDLRSMVEEVRAMPTIIADTTSPLDTLTKRQLEIAQLVSDGLTNREIAKKLELSEWTVVNHLRQVMSKLDCPSRLHVALVILGSDFGDARSARGTG